jgi:type I restriction enzyme M protein
VVIEFETKTRQLIDSLKAICANYGLGNDGNEFKIITQVFLYKFINDKFAYTLKQKSKAIAKADNWEAAFEALSTDKQEMLTMELGADTAILKPHHFISSLFNRQREADFAKLFDDTLRDIALANNDIFSVKTEGGAKITLFDRLSEFISDPSKRDDFCRALINKVAEFSFEQIFSQKYDFFASIFEYLIKDYNKDSGGKYAEYYTPHAVAKIMAAILVRGEIKNVTCYDPSAGSGTLLMSIAHAIGEERCTLYSQDISQKSSSLLRLNLILNNLVHSIPNIIQGNTIHHPYHREGADLRKFDYIVSNPPFKMDFSDYRNDLDTTANSERFFAGNPNIPKKDVDKMSIYLLFIQHIMHSLKVDGKAAIVVPTGFITAQSGIDKKIREKLISQKMLAGVVSMPSNIFASTGTNVSILFLDRSNTDSVVLIDASKLGTKIKDGKNQRTVLSADEEDYIINTFNAKQAVEDFSMVVSFGDIMAKNYSFSAGQYFDVKIEYTDITTAEFTAKMARFTNQLDILFTESKRLDVEIKKHLAGLKYD